MPHLLPTAATLLVALSSLVLLRSPAAAQTAAPEELLERAREEQRRFETYRQSRIPVERPDPGRAGCDENIGRICIWFGGAGEERFPEERPEVEQARRHLIAVLLETREEVRTPWLLGQLVHYLVEQGDPRYAERVARECGIDETWWCTMLLGYSEHVRGAHLEAGATFRDALSAMPPGERRWWTTPRHVLEEDAIEAVEELPPEERSERWELFWRLSDPLFLVPGNDRFTDHLARLVEVRNFEDAAHPQGMEWDDDLEETLVRYGRIVGWSRTHQPRVGDLVQDTRRMVGHHHPMSRGYLFPGDFLASPSDILPESWITAPRVARTWYAPPYAPAFRALETQVARFRRDDRMLVVGAYRPAPPGVDDPSAYGQVADPFEQPPEDVAAALFLTPVEGDTEIGDGWVVDAAEAPGTVVERGDDPEGTFRMLTPPGRYVSSLEVLEPERGRAWRARQGVEQEPLVEGLVDVSDILVLQEGAPEPATLDEAIPWVRPGVRVRAGERFGVAWEVYGLRVREPVRVTVGLTPGRPGFLERVGEFLGVLQADRPVEITFAETAPDRVETVFRTLAMELPELEPGEYTLHVRLELTGRNPVVSSRPIYVEAR